MLLGATGIKAVRKYVGEIEPCRQFHQLHTRTFFVRTSFRHSYKKFIRKMLMKLTPCKVRHSFVGETEWHQLCVLAHFCFAPIG